MNSLLLAYALYEILTKTVVVDICVMMCSDAKRTAAARTALHKQPSTKQHSR
jgi:hypothetical protein